MRTPPLRDVRLAWFEPGKPELARKREQLRKVISKQLALRRAIRSRNRLLLTGLAVIVTAAMLIIRGHIHWITGLLPVVLLLQYPYFWLRLKQTRREQDWLIDEIFFDGTFGMAMAEGTPAWTELALILQESYGQDLRELVNTERFNSQISRHIEAYLRATINQRRELQKASEGGKRPTATNMAMGHIRTEAEKAAGAIFDALMADE